MNPSLVFVGCVLALQVRCVTAIHARGRQTWCRVLVMLASTLVMAGLLSFRIELLQQLVGISTADPSRHWADNLMICSIASMATWVTIRLLENSKNRTWQFSIGNLMILTSWTAAWIALSQRLPTSNLILQVKPDAITPLIAALAYWAGQFCLPFFVGVGGALTWLGMNALVKKPGDSSRESPRHATWLLIGGLIAHVTWVVLASGVQASFHEKGLAHAADLLRSYGTVAIAMLATQTLLLVLPLAITSASRAIPRFAIAERLDRAPQTPSQPRPRIFVAASVEPTQSNLDVRI